MSEELPIFSYEKWFDPSVRRALSRIRFGGIAGKLALVAISSVLCLAAVGVRSSERLTQLSSLIFIFVLAILVVTGILLFAFKHPDQVMMEGREILALHHMQLGAKGMRVIPEESTSPPIEGRVEHFSRADRT